MNCDVRDFVVLWLDEFLLISLSGVIVVDGGDGGVVMTNEMMMMLLIIVVS